MRGLSIAVSLATLLCFAPSAAAKKSRNGKPRKNKELNAHKHVAAEKGHRSLCYYGYYGGSYYGGWYYWSGDDGKKYNLEGGVKGSI